MAKLNISNLTRTRIPTAAGEFQLYYYRNNYDDKEHLALVMGEVTNKPDVLVRIHSECLTGDVFGSLRCDCGPQLTKAMQQIAQAGSGVVVYLRQEGRGIGLLDKLRAYNLQDQGYDTVDANLMLGHQADARDYSIAAKILQDLGLRSLRLLTNNPTKIEGLEAFGATVTERVPIFTAVHAENEGYLRTKVERMRHLMNLNSRLHENGHGNGHKRQPSIGSVGKLGDKRPFVTLTYAQSLDGSITNSRGQAYPISGSASLRMTHQLRSEHDAILIGVGTMLADDPRLTVRLVEGEHPRPIVLDTRLRTPLDAKIFQDGQRQPWFFCAANDNEMAKSALEEAGATVTAVSTTADGQLDLHDVLFHLHNAGIQRLMVEGGAAVISSFLQNRLVDQMVITIAPLFLGGLNAVATTLTPSPRLKHVEQIRLGDDWVIKGRVVWDD